MRHIFTFLLTIGLLSSVQAQSLELKKSASFVQPDESVIAAAQMQQLESAVAKTLNDYALLASLRDPAGGGITAESMKRFNALFSPTAEVYKDFDEKPADKPISFREYGNAAYAALESRGIAVKVNAITLEQIIDDRANGFYIAVVKVEKVHYNYLTATGEVKTTTSGKFLVQEMQLDVPATTLDKARIARIKKFTGVVVTPTPQSPKEQIAKVEKTRKDKPTQPKTQPKPTRPAIAGTPAKFVRYAAFSLGAHSTLVGSQTSDHWDDAHDAEGHDLEVNGGLGYSAGFEIVSNGWAPKRSTRKNTFFSIGARFSTYQVRSELSDVTLPVRTETAVAGSDEQDYLRLVNAVEGVEKLHLGMFELPLGIAFRARMGKANKSAFLLQLRAVPQFMAVGWGRFEGEGNYDGIMFDCFRMLRDGAINPAQLEDPEGFGPFAVGEGVPVSAKPASVRGGFGLAAQISPTFYFNFNDDNPAWGMVIGLDVMQRFGSPIQLLDDRSDIFYTPVDYPNSVAEQYLSQLQLRSVGFRIGLYKQLSRQP